MSIYASTCLHKGWETEMGPWDIAVAIFDTHDYLRLSYHDEELMLTPADAKILAEQILSHLDNK